MTGGGRQAFRKPGQTRVPSIPRYRSGDNNDKTMVALIEAVETLLGARNDPYYKAVTREDLVNLGLLQVNQSAGTAIATIVSGDPTIPLPPGTVPGVQTPHAPLSVTGGGTFNAALISWAYPTYYGHSFTEIWRADTDNLGAAVKIADVTGRFFQDIINPGSTYYYWIRFINIEGNPGPYHSAGSGLEITTAVLVSTIMEQMNDLLSKEDLASSLQTEIEVGAAVETYLETNWSIESAVDSGGNIRVSGMKLINGQGDLSKIIFNTDVFAVAPPFSPGQDEEGEPVFVIGPYTDPVTEITTNRVVMANAVIGDATIGNAAIQELSADKLFVSSGTIADAIIGTGHIDDLMIGNYIQSANYNPATFQGWKLTRGPFPASSMEIFGSIHIRDTSGNTILDAGGASYASAIANANQAYSDISGAPNELSDINSTEGDKLDGIEDNATANRIFQQTTEPTVGGQGPFSDNDFWYNGSTRELYKWNSIAGWQLASDGTLQHFINIGKINSGNTGTYIADAAIGTLFLGDAVLVVPEHGRRVSALNITGTGSFFLCSATVNIPNVGQSSQSIGIQWSIHMLARNNNAKAFGVRVMRYRPGQSEVQVYATFSLDKDQWVSATTIDSPPLGSSGYNWTYRLYFDWNNGDDTDVYAATILLSSVKR